MGGMRPETRKTILHNSQAKSATLRAYQSHSSGDTLPKQLAMGRKGCSWQYGAALRLVAVQLVSAVAQHPISCPAAPRWYTTFCPSARSVTDAPYRVVFLRHGESTWNRDGRYIGWTDVPLTVKGVLEARQAGDLLRNLGIRPDIVYHSYLKRAIKTAWLALEEMEQEYLPCVPAWQLNERMYGLAGRTEDEAVAEFGRDQVTYWTNSFDAAPPPVDEGGPLDPATDAKKYGKLDVRPPRTESLKDTMLRASSYWEGVIKPDLRRRRAAADDARAPVTAMVVAHANTIRSLLCHIDSVPPSRVWDFDVPRAEPIVHSFDESFAPVSGGLDDRPALLPSIIRARLVQPDGLSQKDLEERKPANS